MQNLPAIKTKLAEIITQCASEEILPRFKRVAVELKQDGSMVTEADLAMQTRVKQALQKLWPEIGFIAEEMTAVEQQAQYEQAHQGVWILDPLDGTSNFAMGIPFFSVSIALIKNKEVLLGLVYDPSRNELFTAVKDQGAYLNEQPLRCKPFNLPFHKTIGIVDFKRLGEDLASRLARQPPYASQRSFGSVALDWCWIAAGRGHLYLHGKQKLWDYAAGWLILKEAGGLSCTLEGEPVFNGELKSCSALAACDENLFHLWRQWLGI